MSRVVGAIVVVIAAAIGADRVLGSFGQATSSREVASDFSQLAKADPNKPTEVAKSFDPQSDMGKLIKPIMLKMAQRDESFQNHLAKHDVDDVLHPENLVDAAKRKKSLARINDRLRCFKKYTDDISQLRKQMLDALNSAGMPGGEKAVTEANQRDAQLMKYQVQLMDHYGAMIRFAGEAKASLQEGQLMFSSDADVDKYNAMLEKCKAYEDSLDRIFKKAEKDRAEKLQSISNRMAERL